MNWPRLTAILIVISVVVVGVYDLLAYSQGGYGATISKVLMDAAYANPILPLVVGIVVGHLFWPQPGAAQYRTVSNGGILPDPPKGG